jgi:hypothetical protein
MNSHVVSYEGHARPVLERRRRSFVAVLAQARTAIDKPLYSVTCQHCGQEQETTERGRLCDGCRGALVWPV